MPSDCVTVAGFNKVSNVPKSESLLQITLKVVIVEYHFSAEISDQIWHIMSVDNLWNSARHESFITSSAEITKSHPM